MADWEKEPKIEEQISAGYVWKGVKTLWELLGDEKKKIGEVLGWMVFLGILNMSFPYILKLVFDVLPEVLATGQISRYIWFLIGAMFLVRLAALYLSRFTQEIMLLKSLIKLENSWPADAQKKLLELSMGYHERENTGKKVSKITKGCEKLVDIVIRLYWGLLPQVFYLLINSIFVLVIDWRLGLVFVLPLLPAAWITFLGIKKNAGIWEEWEAGKEKTTGLFFQSIVNIQTVQSYVQEKKEQRKFKKIRQKMREIDLVASIRFQKYFFLTNLILLVAFTTTIVLGLYFILTGQGTLGTVVFIITTGNVTFQSVGHIVHEYWEIARKFVAVERMKKLLDEKPDIKNRPKAKRLDKFEGDFSFDQVSFAYPGKEKAVLDGISFKIPKNQMTALVGKTGEGKTTVFRLVCRMHDISGGSIKVDGHDIRDLDLFWYRQHFAIVPQEVDIFDATLLDNVRYGAPESTREEVEEAMRAAYLDVVLEDEERFPQGLKTQVGERGVRLSGGERQRVGIARAYLALLYGAKVLVLDEATSHLDSEAERAIQDMIDRLREKREISIIVVAHRLSTIKKADWIYVIENGQIAEEGDHEELIEKGGVYAKLVSLQKMGEVRE